MQYDEKYFNDIYKTIGSELMEDQTILENTLDLSLDMA